MARLLSQNEIPIASAAILRGELVAIPTETVYGLAGNALDANVVAKIFSAKERPSFDPLIVHVPCTIKNIEDLVNAGILDGNRISAQIKDVANKLIANFWPGPLTIILPKGKKIPDIVTSGLDQVGIRMPAHPLAQELLNLCKVPLAAPSANRFGRISPTTPRHVEEELGTKIPYILEGGTCEIGVESTVVAVSDTPGSFLSRSATIWLIRPGKITKDQLEALTNTTVEFAQSEHAKASPGMLLSHYAPRKTMFSVKQILDLGATANTTDKLPKTAALLIVSGTGAKEIDLLKTMGISVLATAELSPDGKDQEAARNLFSAMRNLDGTDAELIITTSVPSKTGLWLAIDDRLKRACKSHES
jgi:L-threonylcarbamoyladenylate synthase